MNLCKRACLYSIRKKGKTLTLPGVSAGHGHADADLPFHPIGHGKQPTPISKKPCWAISPSTPRPWKTVSRRIRVSQILDVDGFERQGTPCAPILTLLILTQTGTFWRSTPRALPRCRRAMRMPDGWWPLQLPGGQLFHRWRL